MNTICTKIKTCFSYQSNEPLSTNTRDPQIPGQISLTDQVPCSENASSMGGSQIWLDPRETLTVDDMLKAICVASANDCVVAMAEYIAGSEEAFVQRMNDKAKELGMNRHHI